MNINLIEKSIYYLFLLLPLFLVLGTFLSELSIILICILFLFYSYKTNNFSWLKHEDAKVLFALYLLLIINFIFSEDKNLSFLRNVGFIKYIIFIFAIKNLVFIKKNIFNKVLNLWSFFLIIIIIDLYVELFLGKNILGFYSEDPARLVGFLGQEYKIGSFLVGFIFPIIAFWYHFLFESKKKINFSIVKKIVFIFIILFTLFILIPVGQRSVVLKFLLATILLFYFFPKLKFIKKILFSIFFISLIFSAVMTKESFRYRYVNQIFNDELIKVDNGYIKKLKNYYKHHQHWKHHYGAYLIFKDNPIFGVGNKNYRLKCQRYEKEINSKAININSACAMHPHQIYYEFLSEHGIFGILFIIILFSFFTKIFFNFKNSNNFYQLGSIAYFLFTFVPLIPSGSFFTSFGASLFWINFCFIYSPFKKNGGT